MSFANPGKSAVLTVLALIVIVGVPGFVAYADSSEDTYDSSVDLSEITKVRVYDSVSSAWYDFGVSSVLSDGTYTVIIDSVASDETSQLSDMAIAHYSVFIDFSETGLDSSKISLSTTLDPATVAFKFYNAGNSELASFTSTLDSDSGVYSHEVTAVEAASLTDAAVFRIDFETVATSVEDFEISYEILEKTAIFTNDVVEMIVLTGGILLLIVGTFALSFIDVDTPGKAFRSAKRGIRSAGSKLRRGKR